jgi:hypothetical protein
MQSAIVMEDSYRGVTYEERIILRQLFDKIVKETLGIPELPLELSSNQGGNDVITDWE